MRDEKDIGEFIHFIIIICLYNSYNRFYDDFDQKHSIK